jgi:16S rRNA (uracil1498-N3)-methyltransferase
VQRFYVDERLAGGELRLPESVARQVTTVLRMQPGERVVLFDGSGSEWVGELTRAGKAATVRLVERRDRPASPARRVRLCQALLKGERMEWVLQKGTELGVASFQPLLTERVVARRTDVPERWRRIVIEAAEQCGRTELPALQPPVSLEEALTGEGAHAFCWEGERQGSLWRALAGGGLKELSLYVGPEGGFSDGEAELARTRDAMVVSLGPLILRAETAAVAASSLALLAP